MTGGVTDNNNSVQLEVDGPFYFQTNFLHLLVKCVHKYTIRCTEGKQLELLSGQF